MDEILDRRLREIRNHIPAADPMLMRLISLSADEPARIMLAVHLVLGDVMVRGVPAPDEETAKEIDEEIRWFFRVMAALDEDQGNDSKMWISLLESVKEGVFVSHAQKNATDYVEFNRAMDDGDLWPANVATLPDDLADKALRYLTPRVAVTLEQAAYKSAGESEWTQVGTMRVSLNQVTAWWPSRIEAPDHVAERLLSDDATE